MIAMIVATVTYALRSTDDPRGDLVASYNDKVSSWVDAEAAAYKANWEEAAEPPKLEVVVHNATSGADDTVRMSSTMAVLETGRVAFGELPADEVGD